MVMALRTGLGGSVLSPGCMGTGLWCPVELPGARASVASGSTRGGSSTGSPVRKHVHSSAGLAAEKMFALVMCLALKTFLNNAKAFVKNSKLSVLVWAQKGCFECK